MHALEKFAVLLSVSSQVEAMEYVPEFKPPSAKADQGGNFDAEVRARPLDL